jgi:hypothetical protein
MCWNEPSAFEDPEGAHAVRKLAPALTVARHWSHIDLRLSQTRAREFKRIQPELLDLPLGQAIARVEVNVHN